MLLQALHVLVIIRGRKRVHTKGPSARLVEDREGWYVRGTVRDIDHVLDRDAPLILGHSCVDVKALSEVDALIDLKDRASLGGVVDRVPRVGLSDSLGLATGSRAR